MRVLVAQLDPIIGDFLGNFQKIVNTLEKARRECADLVLFSEMAIIGYPPEDLVLHDYVIRAAEEILELIASKTQGLMVVIGLVRRDKAQGEKSLLNSAAIFQDGKLVGFYDKALLPTYDIFDERRYFEPGHDFRSWTWKGKKIGILICEDLWQHAGYVEFTQYACDPVLELQQENIDLLLNLSASPYQYQKLDIRLKVCQKAATTLGCPVLMCAQVGGNDQLIFDGYSLYVDAQGELKQLAKGFEEDWMVVDLQASLPSYPLHYDDLQDLYQALALGIRDYFYKQGFHQGVLGLSGGIDSALVACLAVEALGAQNVYGIAMPSPFSPPESVLDAKALAHRLGIRFDVISIEKLYRDSLSELQASFQGKPFNATEENIQARLRGLVLMAISNKLGYIVLSTGNKSELAMGYCTLYGDMAGGLAPIADVTKTKVYLLSRWINRQREIIPQAILDKPPSAELRPNQRDTDSLPDYAIVDTVITAHVEDLLSPEEIISKYQLSQELVYDLIHRIHAAEYKRRQAPPGIRVSRKAFLVGRRYPIVQKLA